MLIVGIDEAAVEADLVGGRICCPNCEAGLRPWGHGTEREVRLADRSELTIAIPRYELGHKAIEVLLGDDAKLPNHKAKAYRVLMPLRERDSIRSVETKGAVPR